MRVAVFDYGAGNLHSLLKGLALAGVEPVVEPDPVALARADVIVLPGVGAFGAAAARLAPGREAVRAALAAGRPALGICLGLHLLFEGSDEGTGAGLGIMGGRVVPVEARTVPQMGWNALEEAREPLLADSAMTLAYYANGYVARPDDPAVVTAWSTNETCRFPAAVRAGNTVGVQFHPEKSSAAGVRFLGKFLEAAR